MKISILTLFPDLFTPYLSTSIPGRAATKGLVEYNIVDIRQFGKGNYKTVDGKPYGGGPGMILRPDILTDAWKSIPSQKSNQQSRTILMSASGQTFKQTTAQRLTKLSYLIIICGHYEGVDQRFIDRYVDEEISIGDFVLSGGELAALTVVDATIRLIPGVLNKPDATLKESFIDNLLEYPQYTRPEVYENRKVPDVLLSGNHQEIAKWRETQAHEKTAKLRPDLLTQKD